MTVRIRRGRVRARALPCLEATLAAVAIENDSQLAPASLEHESPTWARVIAMHVAVAMFVLSIPYAKPSSEISCKRLRTFQSVRPECVAELTHRAP